MITERIRTYLESEAKAIKAIPLDDRCEETVRAILNCKGKVFTTGVGKAGFIARKAASTFSTTGSPSLFVHPAESAHGDAGVFAEGDILIAYSNSGKTREVIETVKFAKSLGVEKIIAVSATPETPLAEEADLVLPIGKITEACPYQLTPTSSTAAMIAISDALALIVMEERGFSREDWARRHHGGYLGEKSRKTD